MCNVHETCNSCCSFVTIFFWKTFQSYIHLGTFFNVYLIFPKKRDSLHFFALLHTFSRTMLENSPPKDFQTNGWNTVHSWVLSPTARMTANCEVMNRTGTGIGMYVSIMHLVQNQRIYDAYFMKLTVT